MRFSKMLGIALVLLSAVAIASQNKMGIHDVSKVTFDTAIHIGSTVLPAGSYVVRHTMEGEEHVMSFELVGHKQVFKVKCTLAPLAHKAPKDESVIETTSTNEKILRELTFSGDTAKHVF
ncbi:MAG: hypothetical protein WA477_13360 [Candidatus Sulfotelmatobacter sp.]